MELKRELFETLTESIGKRLGRVGKSEEKILEDFEQFREKHREARRLMTISRKVACSGLRPLSCSRSSSADLA